MRALILGVTGFAGRYLAAELARLGYEVWGAARSPGAERSAVPLATRRLLRCDVTSAEEVRDALAVSAPDAVVLLAGVSSPPAAGRAPDHAFHVHAVGAANVLAAVAASARRIRVLLVTSSEVYGESGRNGSPLVEDAPLRPVSVYAASKAAADLAGAAFAAAHGVDVVRVRPFNHTGPGQRRDFVCPDFAAQVAEVAAGRRPPVIDVGNLDVRRDFSDVRDIVRGYAAALLHGRSGGVYNLCSGRAIAVRDVLAELCAIAGVTLDVREDPARRRPGEISAFWGSADKARTELGWRPEIPWRRTLEDLLAHFSQTG